MRGRMSVNERNRAVHRHGRGSVVFEDVDIEESVRLEVWSVSAKMMNMISREWLGE